MQAPKFTESWEDVISDIAEDPSYMDGMIELHDPSLDSLQSYDFETGTWSGNNDTLVWGGPARIQHIYASRGSNLDGGSNRNPTGMRTFTFQIPIRVVSRDGVEYPPYLERIRRGWSVRVINGHRDKSLETMSFTIDSAANSSHAAVRTIVAISNVEAELDHNI